MLPPTLIGRENLNPSDISKVSPYDCTYTTHPQKAMMSKYFILRAVIVHVPTHPQKAMISKYLILRTPNHPSDISKVSLCHCTHTHPPTNSYDVKIFHLRTPTHPSHKSKVSPCHCTYTHPSANTYDVKIFQFRNNYPPIGHIQSVTLSLYIYPPTHKLLQCQNISF